MSFFARASWPGDHRDEMVAGALVAAVIVVLGYASGIGAPAPTDLDSAAPPAAGMPSASPSPSEGGASGESGAASGDSGAGSSSGAWPAGEGMPVVSDTSSTNGHGHHGWGGESGGNGHTPEPSPPSDSPSPTSSPTSPESCGEGEVHLVRPLLNGILSPATDLMDGLSTGGYAPSPDLTPSPIPTSTPSSAAAEIPSLCVGVAPKPSVMPEVAP